MRLLIQIARVEVAAGNMDSVGVDVAFMTALSLKFEAEARRWGQENGVEIVGSGFYARPGRADHPNRRQS